MDDILIAASEPVIAKFLPRLTGEWKRSDPEWVKTGAATKFCGLDKEEDAHGDGYRIHQESYARSTLSRSMMCQCFQGWRCLRRKKSLLWIR